VVGYISRSACEYKEKQAPGLRVSPTWGCRLNRRPEIAPAHACTRIIPLRAGVWLHRSGSRAALQGAHGRGAFRLRDVCRKLITPEWLPFKPYCPHCGVRGLSFVKALNGFLDGDIANEYYACDWCGVQWLMKLDPERGLEWDSEWAQHVKAWQRS
jgi:DNA-directed RNA polymerase subunit RPC12/RpoP